MTEYNVDLMMQVREQITTHPETHDQQNWVCGTTACIAGWAVQLAGHELKWFTGSRPRYAVFTADGRHIGAVAREVLGLYRGETDHLFHTLGNAEAVAMLDRFIEAGKNGERVDFNEDGGDGGE